MRFVIIGASGNIGSSILDVLALDSPRNEVTAIARRPPMSGPLAGLARWIACDISDPAAESVLRDVCRGADAVIHLAWLIQSSHAERSMRATNVDGTARLLDVLRSLSTDGDRPDIIAASSIGAYSPGSKSVPVAESWPTEGIPTSIYSQHKVAVERLLDDYERETTTRVIRIRPGLVFSDRAASSQARYFLGPFIPMTLLRRSLIPLVPAPERLVVPIVHSLDVARTFVAVAKDNDARGAFNVATDEPLTAALLARVLRARTVPVPAGLLRALAEVTWRLRLQPTDAGWVDLAFGVPLMSTARIRECVHWSPTFSAGQTVCEWLEGMRQRSGGATPVLRPARNFVQQALGALPAVGPRFGKRI